jgi:hypothetical protein
MNATVTVKAASATGVRNFRVAADSNFWPLFALGLLLAMQFTLVFTRAINWDEFHFFHEVARFSEGELIRPLQTLHTRLFYWLPGLFETSVDHIVAARIFMFGFELITLVSIYFISGRFVTRDIALFAPLLYLSAGYVFQHGTSFRVDPMVTAGAMAGLAILARSRLRPFDIVLFGACIGFAAMVSIKIVLLAPAFIGMALARWQSARWGKTDLVKLVSCALAALTAFAILFLWHGSAVTLPSGANDVAITGLSNTPKWIFFVGIPPYWGMALKSVFISLFLYMALAATPFLVVRKNVSHQAMFGMLGLLLPILSILFYTNTAAYFYVFILAPAAAGCVFALQWTTRRYSQAFVAIALLANGVTILALEDRSIIDRQRQLERNVYEIFPNPVHYFDNNGMLGSWEKENNFTTSWGLTKYRDAGIPAYREAMLKEPVPLFLANDNFLEAAISGVSNEILLPEDNAVLRNNYLERSWLIWVAGKSYKPQEEILTDEFLVPGIYTVHRGALLIDGIRYEEGSTPEISRGSHQIELVGDSEAVLIWGDHLPEPSAPLEPGPLYTDF